MRYDRSQRPPFPCEAELMRRRRRAMKRLLVVDDALFMRKLISGVAAEAGWEVAGEAANGEEAIALYQRLKPDLVTMDLVMPIMGGLEALGRFARSIPRPRSSW